MNIYKLHDNPKMLHGHTPEHDTTMKDIDDTLKRISEEHSNLYAIERDIHHIFDVLPTTPSSAVNAITINLIKNSPYIEHMALFIPNDVYNKNGIHDTVHSHMEHRISHEITTRIDWDDDEFSVDDEKKEIRDRTDQEFGKFEQQRKLYNK